MSIDKLFVIFLGISLIIFILWFFFGDKNEDTVTNGAETFRFSQLIKDRAAYRYAEELGTEPNVYYLPPVNRNFPFERGLKDLSDEELKRYRNVIDVEKITKE